MIIACGGARLGAAEDQNSLLPEPAVHVRAGPCSQHLGLRHTHNHTHTSTEVVFLWLHLLINACKNEIMSDDLQNKKTFTNTLSYLKLCRLAFVGFLRDIKGPRHHVCYLFFFTVDVMPPAVLIVSPYIYTLPSLVYFHSCNTNGFSLFFSKLL